jgi:diaminohydroxyphosphoribosylaminopyrimidine deaminase/5-amino-6-(5-phosphoribosylamino)uracil reductase
MHEQFMLAALAQAWLGRGVCAPNPAVGAVAVLNGEIIAQAFHSGAGSPHAEQKLLNVLPDDCSNLSIYVTLEPCNHWGRTPPCVDALIAKRVKSVVYGYRDPNPLVASNDTSAQLRAAGIDVHYFPMLAVDSFYQSYTYWTRTGMPWVTVKMAQTLDGKIAGPSGKPEMLSNQACFEFTHEQRLHTDVILTTARTIHCDNSAFNVRSQQNVIQDKVVAILDRNCILDPDAKIYHTAQHCLIYHDEAHNAKARERCTLMTMPSDEQGINLESVLRHLGSLGYHDVWVEAGAILFGALHRAGLVKRTYLYIVPRVLGNDAVALYHEVDFFKRPHQIEWQSMNNNMIAVIDWS